MLPVFVHPLQNWQNCFDYFADVLPHQVACSPVVFPARSVYENYNRKGLNLNEYAKLVESNKKLTKQVKKPSKISKNM
ncbi:MAG: hypothetical protein R2861_01770 [Desulfobacterales bacterium]